MNIRWNKVINKAFSAVFMAKSMELETNSKLIHRKAQYFSFTKYFEKDLAKHGRISVNSVFRHHMRHKSTRSFPRKIKLTPGVT